MQRSPLEVVHQALELLNRADWDAFEQFIHPEIQAVDRQPPIDLQDHIVNRAEYMRGTRGWFDMFEGARMDIQAMWAEGDHVICDVFYRGMGPASGAVTRQHQIDVYRVDAGVIVRAECGFHTVEEARAALPALSTD
jgi:ketosteroid isomerase-like protein